MKKLFFQKINLCGKGRGRSLGNERGAALIIALVILALMSLLGVMALNTTDTELSISRNYRASQQAFYAAERAITYATVSEDVYSTIGVGAVTLDGAHATAIAADTPNSHLKTDAVNEVRFLTTGPLPPGSGSDPTYFQSRFYTINVTAEGPSRATSRIEAQVARIVPK